jgi:hypothetical protein
MRVDEVSAWGSENWVPEKFRGPGPHELSEADLDDLSQRFDVALVHLEQDQPTKRERGRGVKSVPPRRVLWLDVVGGKFRQR